MITLAAYESPDWVGMFGDVGIVVGAALALIALVAAIIKGTRLYDARRDSKFAREVKAIMQPVIDKATQAIQPNYRNGGHSLADVAEEVRGAKAAIKELGETGMARDEQIEQMQQSLASLDKRSRIMSLRQQDIQANMEQSQAERDAMVEGMLDNGAIVWTALEELGADIPPMVRPPTKNRKKDPS